jgi:hypothetical protein
LIRGIIGLTLLAFQPAEHPATTLASIVFVCEYGAAKSVIATAYFNKLATDRGLPYRRHLPGYESTGRLVGSGLGLKEDSIIVPSGSLLSD